MEEESKTKKQLLKEISALKSEISYLKKSLKYNNFIAENTTDNIGILTFDLNVKYLYVSPSVKQVLDYEPEDMVGHSFFEFLHPDDKKIILPLLKQYLKKIANKIIRFDDPNLMERLRFRFKSKDGSWHHMESTVNFIGKNILSVTRDITQEVLTEEKLKKSEEKFRKAFDISPDALSISRLNDGRFVAVNRGFLKILGYEKEEVIGRSVAELNIWYDSNDRDKVVKLITENGRVIEFETHFRTKKGEVLMGLLSANVIDIDGVPHMLSVTRDVTARKKAEAELFKLSTVVKQSPAVVVITDLEGRIEYVNPKFTELTGYTFEEAVGQRSNILKSGDQPERYYKELWDTITSGKTWRGEFHNKKKNGELFWESALVSPVLDDKGNIVNYVKVAEDITERKNIEFKLQKQNEEYAALNEEYQTVNEELRAANEKLSKNYREIFQMNKRLEEALAKAEESDRLKTAFLHNMSHEIRTPMNGIMGFAQLLKNPGLNAVEQEKYLEIIHAAGNRMLNTIDDLMKISMIESGQVQISTSEVRVNDLLLELHAFFTPEAEQKGLTISPDFAEEDVVIQTDKDKLYSVFSNLIKNAVKYTKQGSVTFGCQRDGEKVRFFVKDTGIGIPKERQEAIFDRFVQADIADNRAFEGNGLGLSISKAYVEMMGGTIWVESEPDKGSRFYFTLPQVLNGKETNRDKKPGKPVADRAAKEKYNLIIVEDEPSSEQYMSVVLKPVVHTVFHATNGEEAVRLVKEHPETDVVLMDLKMPVLNGYDATKEIRKFNKEVIIIAQTAYAFPGDREKTLAAGCNDYISKPFAKNELLEIIRKNMGK